ncbi:hypothetical protein [Nonomuraea soli]|uniref:Uncharacterized protein n=1 Tax=Nonomuraea soli TaxID=1032476 RepID=A0A7W0CEE3_9ACTN|nr:hypothetical protein [Nonomuraea soli]MBA2889502.1 hypothetical protein [Nonomuraea soli]
MNDDIMLQALTIEHRERIAQADHHRLVRKAPRRRNPVRHRIASALHHLANAID